MATARFRQRSSYINHAILIFMALTIILPLLVLAFNSIKPSSEFGALTYDMWRAVRLVVDTGMHYKGWSRDKAIEFFKENAAKTDQDIVNEIDRYLVMPGQALAYKIGQLKIMELKNRSKEILNDKFDIKEFHHVILGEGALPLDILEEKIDEYIQNTQ